jgi:hypothetical protein
MTTPDDFKPGLNDPIYFQQDAHVVGMGISSRISPMYCATVLTASILAKILADLKPKIVMASPLGEWPRANQFFQDSMVPWLQFPDGTMENAGLLAATWTHGYPTALVEQWVRTGLEASFAARAASN